jgi:phosphate transport system ATP-binding protein
MWGFLMTALETVDDSIQIQKQAIPQTQEAIHYKIKVENVSVLFNGIKAIENVSIKFPEKSITALIGPSGCGKTTLLRTLNRMHDITPNSRVEGKITLDNINLYSNEIEPTEHRRRVGMVFQKPNPFPSMSIYDNVVSGLKLNGLRNRKELDWFAENSLKQAYLWDEVKGMLHKPALELSGGQQQRLCIARALAVKPDVLLMDEPTSALDPISTQKIEETITQLKKDFTIIIVTHNMQQAVRVSDYTGFMYLGKLIEHDKTKKIFSNPSNQMTQNYVDGIFG